MPRVRVNHSNSTSSFCVRVGLLRLAPDDDDVVGRGAALSKLLKLNKVQQNSSFLTIEIASDGQ